MARNHNILPPSPRRSPASRSALTLAEVLIAMGILTIGLLGVASVFPVGGFYMQSGDIADQGGAIAQAALEDAIIRGHLDPENWVVHNLDPLGGTLAVQKLISGVEVTATGALQQNAGLKANRGRAYPAIGMLREQFLAIIHGGAYAIDPAGFAGVFNDRDMANDIVEHPLHSGPLRRFPAFGGESITTSPQWNAWQSGNGFWPVRRVTTLESRWFNSSNGNDEYLLPYPASRQLMTADDDLALALPEDGDVPARQRWEAWSAGTSNAFASSRQSNGDYSWLITVAPESSPQRDTFAEQPDAYPVEVSTVVFHKREPTRGVTSTLEAERLVKARVVSSSPGGGELLLQRRPAVTDSSPEGKYKNEPEVSPFEDLREGQYVMVVGPHPLSTQNAPRLALRWCRVLNLQNEGRPNLNGTLTQLGADESASPPTETVLVALRGADWPWQRASNLTNDMALSNDLRVAILPGVVAVHTKTMRLEAGSEWSIE